MTAIVGILGAAAGSVLTYLLTKSKTDAEIRKLNAETDKIRAELASSTASNYKSDDTAEKIIYEYANGGSPHDFRGEVGHIWVGDKPIGGKGAGTLSIDRHGILSIERTNKEGRFEIWLQRYIYNGVEKTVLPKNELIAGRRKLRVSCKAKASNGTHCLRFVFKDVQTQKWVAKEQRQVTGNDWTPLDLYFQISPAVDVRLRIDDLEVSDVPSSVQILNLEIAEKIA